MKRLWRRLLRLFQESRIRLSTAELRFDLLKPGDWLQIGPRLWRIEERLNDGAGLWLAAPDADRTRASGRARLRYEGDAVCPWVLEEPRGKARLSSEDLLHFPMERKIGGDEPGAAPRRGVLR